MKLAGYSKQFSDLSVLRDLTKAELAKHDEYTPVITEARDRLRLFDMLAHNYREWKDYVDSLLSVRAGRRDHEWFHLDRLLLNYLTCAYTIREHFEVSFRQRFRHNELKQKAYRSFVDRLCTEVWAVAFFFDFRGYVQHRGLGIGGYGRHASSTSITLTITCDAKELVEGSRDWNRSALSGIEGKIELVPLLRDFHVHMLQSYGAFVADTFFPELRPAAEFYSNLAKEVQEAKPRFRMVFFKDDPEITKEGQKTKLSLDLVFVPNDLLTELNISAPKVA